MPLVNTRYIIIALAILITGYACSPSNSVISRARQPPATISKLQLIGEYDVPYNLPYKETTIGGLSGIDYDSTRKVYYLISDDRSDMNPARYYTAKIFFTENSLDSVSFVAVTPLLQANGKPYPNAKTDPTHTPDPEALRYNAKKDQMVWASEGERIVTPQKVVLENPAITEIQQDGSYIDTLVLPANMQMKAIEKGPRQNGAFEGLTFADDFNILFVNAEVPLYEDGQLAGTGDSTGNIRIIKYDMATKKPVAQYGYKIEAVAYPPNPVGGFKINGVADLLAVDKEHLLVVERSASSGQLTCVIKIFMADLSHATDVSNIASLQGPDYIRTANKHLLLDMSTMGRFVDNVEGVTFGPTLPNGHKTLVLVADNNFSRLERTQFWLFEVIP